MHGTRSDTASRQYRPGGPGRSAVSALGRGPGEETPHGVGHQRPAYALHAAQLSARLGVSVAHRESETLVAESKGFRDDNCLDIAGNPLTDVAQVTERIRRPNFGGLEIEIRVDDPKAYTKPWTVMMHQKAVVDTEMVDLMCQENNKDVAHMKL